MSVDSPIGESRIIDWELLENIWDHAMSRYLKCDVKESPLLVSEKPFDPPSARQRFENVEDDFHTDISFPHLTI
jgi:actin-related protein